MVNLSEEKKNELLKYIDKDGRFIIDDSLPEELKNDFMFFNSRGDNAFELLFPEKYNNSDDEFDEAYLEEVDFDNEFSSNETESNDNFIEGSSDSSVSLDDLNDIF